MGTFFPDSIEFPDYEPFPSLMIGAAPLMLEAARLGVVALVIAALCLSVVRRTESLRSNRLDWLPYPNPPVIFDDAPHIHMETQDPTPPASHSAGPAQGTSSGDDLSWRGNSLDVANDVVMQAHRARAHYGAYYDTQPSSAPLFYIATLLGPPPAEPHDRVALIRRAGHLSRSSPKNRTSNAILLVGHGRHPTRSFIGFADSHASTSSAR